MTDTVNGAEADREYVGYGPAAAYLGLSRNTMSHYVNGGCGPKAQEQPRIVKGHALKVFLESDLDAWKNRTRPGKGFRTDLAVPGRIRGFAGAARYLGMSTAQLQRLVDNGEGPVFKWVPNLTGSGKRPQFSIRDLDSWKSAPS